LLIQNDFAIRYSEFELLLKCVRQYLLRKREWTIVGVELEDKEEALTKKPKTPAAGKKKKGVLDDDAEEVAALTAQKKQLEANIQLLYKDIGFIAIRSIWPGNTHRAYSHPMGNRDPSAVQKAKSKFHTDRFDMMEKYLEKLFCLTIGKLEKYFENSDVPYTGTDFQTVYGSGRTSKLKRLVSILTNHAAC
jgi:hypothetical protein